MEPETREIEDGLILTIGTDESGLETRDLLLRPNWQARMWSARDHLAMARARSLLAPYGDDTSAEFQAIDWIESIITQSCVRGLYTEGAVVCGIDRITICEKFQEYRAMIEQLVPFLELAPKIGPAMAEAVRKAVKILEVICGA